MARYKRLVPIAGSEAKHWPGAAAGKKRLPGKMRVTLVLRPAAPPEEAAARIEDLAARLPAEREHVYGRALSGLCGVTGKDIARIEEFAQARGLRVIEADSACGSVLLEGPVPAVERAFGVTLAVYEHELGSYRSHAGPVHVPAELEGLVEAVLGLDERPVVRRHSIGPALRHQGSASPLEVAQAYKFPKDAAGRGQSIAIVELGGGFFPADMKNYFARLGIPAPKLRVRELEGQKNAPADAAAIRRFWESLPGSASPGGGFSAGELEQIGWSIETTMDIQLAAALAPGARITVYFAPITVQGKFHAVRAVLNEAKAPPAILSLSWGAHEDSFNASSVSAMERLLRMAVLCGITVCCSSGDDGDGTAGNGTPQVSYPASSLHVLACGGTHLVLSVDPKPETVWKEEFAGRHMASTGGASSLFPLPNWQVSAKVRDKAGRDGRGVPDVAAKADVAEGYGILVAGLDIAMGGTSAAAPLWAALAARLNEKLGTPVGFLAPLLYQQRFRGALRDITRGDNGPRFRASRGWDPCTGWGTPNGTALLAALRGG
jgi:kumamolisin